MSSKDEYRAKLLDPRWQKMRLKVLERDEFTCKQCFDSESTLHVHHRWYQAGKEPWDYDPRGLLTLCETCHAEESEFLSGSVADLVLLLKQAGAMSREFRELGGAFLIGMEKQLSEHDWSALAWTLHTLVIDRYSGGGFGGVWLRALDEFNGWCSARAEQLRAGTALPDPRANGA